MIDGFYSWNDESSIVVVVSTSIEKCAVNFCVPFIFNARPVILHGTIVLLTVMQSVPNIKFCCRCAQNNPVYDDYVNDATECSGLLQHHFNQKEEEVKKDMMLCFVVMIRHN